MQKPISIDDMFSMVTREVRLTTKNMQRPFKYASLENIVCLTPACSNAPTPAAGDIFQQANQSEADELQIALQTKNADALETFLQKYPDTTKRAEVLSAIAALKRSQFTEWTLFEIGDKRFPHFMQLSSIQQFSDRAAARVKWPVDPSVPKVFHGKSFPDSAYIEATNVYSCTKPSSVIAEDSIFNESGSLLYHYKWGPPEYVNLAIGSPIESNSVASVAQNIVCHENISTPLVSKSQIGAMKFNSLSNTPNGDGELFYGLAQNAYDNQTPNQKDILSIVRYSQDRNTKDFFQEGTSIPDPPNFRTEVDHILLRCDENKFLIDHVEQWNASNELVRMEFIEPAAGVKFSEFQPVSAFATLQQIYCGNGYAGLGIQIAAENGSIKVTNVFDGSPAKKVGVKTNDVVTRIDNESVNGLTPEQVIEKLRGPANTTVALTIMREGKDKPVELTITREIIQMQSTQIGPSK